MAENVTSQKSGVTSSNFQTCRSLSCYISLDSRRREDSENIGLRGLSLIILELRPFKYIDVTSSNFQPRRSLWCRLSLDSRR